MAERAWNEEKARTSATQSMWTILRALHTSAAAADGGGGGCPVLHGKPAAGPGKPNAAVAGKADGGSSCPVLHGGAGNNAQPVNPLNMMPAPNQERAEDQSSALSTERVTSTIPTGDATGGTWVYPSPQMFYNSLRRKGKAEGVDESSMDSVVAIHNNMNETTWKRVLEWEQLHPECTATRKLVSFMGRPTELSNKAAAKYYLGLAPRPFDRHDWTVDRCGEHVRYIIDYYDIASKRSSDRLPSLHEEDAVPSIAGVHMYRCAYVYACAHARAHAHVCVMTRTPCARLQSARRSIPLPYACICTCTYMHIHAHTCTYMHIHAHTCTCLP